MQVIERLRLAQPRKLYVASNGPNPAVTEDVAKVREVRAAIAAIDWDCAVSTLLRDDHLDVKNSVNEAIDWFFENESEGVILEDDCVPDLSFFRFCDELLEKYRSDTRVAAISGSSFAPDNLPVSSSYYFSKYVHVWGWATWRRAWLLNDRDMSFWPTWRRSAEWRKKFSSRHERQYWLEKFDGAYSGKIVTWDYQFLASAWRQLSVGISPAVNLVTNIGDGPDGTHRPRKKVAERKTKSMTFPLKPPDLFEELLRADKFVFDFHYNGKSRYLTMRIRKLMAKLVTKLVLDPIYVRLFSAKKVWLSLKNEGEQ